MKNKLISVLLACWLHVLHAQEPSPMQEMQWENNAQADDNVQEDDTNEMQWDELKRRPVDINQVDGLTLENLGILTSMQVENLVAYRKLLGPLISLYELQAIPGWDLVTIKKIAPYIIIKMGGSMKEVVGKRFRDGEHQLLIRISRQFDEQGKDPAYSGSPQRIFSRYRYNYKNLLQYGILGDKDAGETFLRGKNRMGFDFCSFHFFVRNVLGVRAIAIGDFTVNMGQGLLHWQGLAFEKSAAMSLVRQSPVFKPYSSAGEYNFHRGVAVTCPVRSLELNLFVSLRKLTANVDTDERWVVPVITSINSSGYHRTENEMSDKNILAQRCAGVVIAIKKRKWKLAWNGIYYGYSMPLQKPAEPYNLFAVSGRQWWNSSIDYRYSYRNVQLFGEWAVDRYIHKAILNGLLVSVDPRVDISVLVRQLDAGYQSIAGNAFTENSKPGNENGVYAGIVVRPLSKFQLTAYADLYRFHWLRYRDDAPGRGVDYILQGLYSPTKTSSIALSYRTGSKTINEQLDMGVLNVQGMPLKRSLQLRWQYTWNKAFQLRTRTDMVWIHVDEGPVETGSAGSFDVLYKPLMKRYSCIGRLQYFDTGSYDSRVYAYENDLPYTNTIAVFSGTGWRYYVLLKIDATRRITCSAKLGQTFRKAVPDDPSVANLAGTSKLELRLQLQAVL